MTASMAMSMVVMPMTAEAAVPAPEPTYIWRFVTSRENQLRMPIAAGCDTLRSADRRPSPHR